MPGIAWLLTVFTKCSVLWVELCLLLKDVEILTPSACECDLFGNGLFADAQLKMRSLTWKAWTQQCAHGEKAT